jgi:hypothetical protein
MLYLGMDKMEDAVKGYSEALRVQPENLDALAYRGYAQGELANQEAAAADLCRALELMAAEYASDEPLSSRYIDFDDIIAVMSGLKIDCYPPEDPVAGFPNWPADLDLADGYNAHPLNFHGIAPGDWAYNGEVNGRLIEISIEDGFWFELYDGSQAIYGYAVHLESEEEIEFFDSKPDGMLKQGIEGLFAGNDEYEFISTSRLENSDVLGDWSKGEMVEYEYMGERTRHEVLDFRLGDTGMTLYQYYPAPNEPAVDIVQTGDLILERINE